MIDMLVVACIVTTAPIADGDRCRVIPFSIPGDESVAKDAQKCYQNGKPSVEQWMELNDGWEITQYTCLLPESNTQS